MRLDTFLKTSRIIKRRTVACGACKSGRVKVNDKAQNPGYAVKFGDIIEVEFGGGGKVKIEVLSVEETPGKENALNMYRKLTPSSESAQGENFPAKRKDENTDEASSNTVEGLK